VLFGWVEEGVGAGMGGVVPLKSSQISKSISTPRGSMRRRELTRSENKERSCEHQLIQAKIFDRKRGKRVTPMFRRGWAMRRMTESRLYAAQSS